LLLHGRFRMMPSADDEGTDDDAAAMALSCVGGGDSQPQRKRPTGNLFPLIGTPAIRRQAGPRLSLYVLGEGGAGRRGKRRRRRRNTHHACALAHDLRTRQPPPPPTQTEQQQGARGGRTLGQERQWLTRGEQDEGGSGWVRRMMPEGGGEVEGGSGLLLPRPGKVLTPLSPPSLPPSLPPLPNPTSTATRSRGRRPPWTAAAMWRRPCPARPRVSECVG
jgi:hypothetical protein